MNELLGSYAKRRRAAKESWVRGVRQVQEAINATDKAHSLYRARCDGFRKVWRRVAREDSHPQLVPPIR